MNKTGRKRSSPERNQQLRRHSLRSGRRGRRFESCHSDHWLCHSFFRTFSDCWRFPSQPPIPLPKPNTDLRSRDAWRPRLARVTLDQRRVQGMPGARCTRGLVCKAHKKMRTRAYRFSGEHPAFPAQWLYGLCRDLLGDEFLFVTVAAGFWPRRSGWIASATDNLTPATGAGTTRFCRTHQRRSSARGHGLTGTTRPARTARARRCRVHRNPARNQRRRTIAPQG